MKKLVSFFGDKSDVFVKLNEEAKAYAKTKDIEFVWKPQLPFDQEDVIRCRALWGADLFEDGRPLQTADPFRRRF